MIESLLSRLDKVRQTGRENWIACCPAHDDRTPSLALRETDEGQILIHCFAGCSVEEVVSAAGMELQHLFPESKDTHKPISKPFPAQDILRCLFADLCYLQVYANAVKRGEEITERDRRKINATLRRFAAAREVAKV